MRYSGEVLPPIKYFDETGWHDLANSLSKFFAPGTRLGYICADELIIRKAKTATNSHTNVLTKSAAGFFKRGCTNPT